MARFIVYGRPGCFACKATVRRLEQLRASYVYIDVAELRDEGAGLRAAGFTSLPVVRAFDPAPDEAVLAASWSGYRPENIARYAA